MKIYIVSADTYDGGYGSEITILGVYSDEQKAKEKYQEADSKYTVDVKMSEAELNADCKIYLGGYSE